MSSVAATDDTSLTTNLKTELERAQVREQRQIFLANLMSSLNGTFPLSTTVLSSVMSAERSIVRSGHVSNNSGFAVLNKVTRTL